MKIALIALGVLGIVTTILPLSRSDVWWIRIFDFLRLQISVVIIATFAAYVFFGWDGGLTDGLFLIVLSGCLGLLDPRVGRGFYNTFHAEYPFMRLPLDHCFHSNHFRLVDFRRLAYYGSDHFPVYIKLSYEPDAEVEQDELQASKSQQKVAQEKISKKLAEASPDEK